MRKKMLYTGHFLMGSRFDNYIRLLAQNRFRIKADRIPEALYIGLVSLLFFIPAILERAIYSRAIRKHRLRKDPVFIMGFWRSGTTFLQNLMCSDTRYGFCDPVSTTTFNNSRLLGWLIAPGQAKILKGARPMDNMQYRLGSPMEDVFALATVFPYCIDNMLAFSGSGFKYMDYGFISEMDEKVQKEWRRKYRYVLDKMTMINHDRRLILKSPDNTCNIRMIDSEFPEASYVNIYRNPYTVVMSTINMFVKQGEMMRLQRAWDDPEMLEDGIIQCFEKTYRNFFSWRDAQPEGKVVDIKYEEFELAPVETMRQVYSVLGLESFEEAQPALQAYVDAQAGYRKNSFELSESLKEKINSRLGFYFERYGYEQL